MDAWEPDPANSRFITKVNRRKTYLIVIAVVGIILFIGGLTTMIILLVKDNDSSPNTVDVTVAPNTTLAPLTTTPPSTQNETIIIAFNIGFQSVENETLQKVKTSVITLIDGLPWEAGNIKVKLVPYSDISDNDYAVDNLKTADDVKLYLNAFLKLLKT
uniref:Uncharacterized protein n=1 Tax=Panagrolaimus superbus TaxID=310955 RepID=A0A914YEV1_9BILA